MSVFTSAPQAATLSSPGGGIFLIKTGEGGGSGTQVSGVQACTLPIPGRGVLSNVPAFRAVCSYTATYPIGTYTVRSGVASILGLPPSVTINGQTIFGNFLPKDWIRNRATVTQASLTSNVATYTTAGAHGYIVGDVVFVGGLANNPAVLNQSSGIITAATASTFSVALTNADISGTAETTGFAQGFVSGTVRADGGIVNVTGTSAVQKFTGRFETISEFLVNAGGLTAAYPGLTLNGALGPEVSAQLCLIASVSVTSGTLPSPVSFTLNSFSLVEN